MNREEIERIDALAKKATPGPYFVASDDADDTTVHKDSGLAMIDTGRCGDWPVLRLGEWPTTEFVAAVLNAWPTLRDAALAKDGWVNISERVPEEGDMVYVWNGEFCTVANYEGVEDGEHQFSDRILGCAQIEEEGGVTHWMQLPDPPMIAAQAGKQT